MTTTWLWLALLVCAAYACYHTCMRAHRLGASADVTDLIPQTFYADETGRGTLSPCGGLQACLPRDTATEHGRDLYWYLAANEQAVKDSAYCRNCAPQEPCPSDGVVLV